MLCVVVDGAGKTTFADELADALRAIGRADIGASVDGFHHPGSGVTVWGETQCRASTRIRTITRRCGGCCWTHSGRAAMFDVDREVSVQYRERQAPAGSVLFLHRPELRGAWNDSVFLPRAGEPYPGAPFSRRYIGGNRLYFREADLERQAGVVVDNADLARPVMVRERPLAQ